MNLTPIKAKDLPVGDARALACISISGKAIIRTVRRVNDEITPAGPMNSPCVVLAEPGRIRDRFYYNAEDSLFVLPTQSDEVHGSGYPVEKLTLCTCCDHFIEKNTAEGEGLAAYVHLDNGEQEYDHEATPGESKTMAEWKESRPDLFKSHPDGEIGPNSEYHSQRGKDNRSFYEDNDVLYLNEQGHVVQWEDDGKDHRGPYTSSETPEEYGLHNLTDIEKSRLGL